MTVPRAMRRRAGAVLVALLPTTVVVACYSAPPGGSGGTSGTVVAASGCKPDIDTIQKTIFLPRCATSGCHGTTDPGASLELATPGVADRLVNQLGGECTAEVLVVPGNADASFIVRKLSDEKPSCGVRMPSGPVALAADDVECIKQWIAGLQPGGPVPEGGGADVTTTCNAGETACNAVCTDTTSDPANCGTCGKACPTTAQFCVAGACTASCELPRQVCGASCVDTQADVRNCGSCGNACESGKVCSAGTCKCGSTVLYKTQIEQAIWLPNCATSQCHGRVTAPPGSLDLRAGKSYAELVNVKSSSVTCSSRTLVQPGSVAGSYLTDKLKGNAGICGTQMPKTGGISPAELAAVEAWICNGAKND